MPLEHPSTDLQLAAGAADSTGLTHMSRARMAFLAGLAVAAAAATIGGTLSAFSQTTDNTGSTFQAASSFFTCPNQSITAGYLTGMEMGRTAYNGTGLQAAAGNVTADGAVKRTGGYSLKVVASGSASYAGWTNTAATTSTSQVARFALYLDSLPGADVNQLFGMNSAGGLQLRYVASSQKLAIAIKPTSAGAYTVVAADTTVQAGTWYSIEIRYRVAAPNHIADWRINGSPQSSASVAAAASSTYTTYFGTASTSTDSYTAHYDDMIITPDSTVYPLGDGRVQALRPNAMGTSVGTANFRTDGGGAIGALTWQRMVEVPMTSTTDYIEQFTVSSTSYVELAMQDTAETCIRAANGYFSFHNISTGGGSNNLKMSVFDGTRESVLRTGDLSANNLSSRDFSAAITPLTTWSQTALNGLVARYGYGAKVSPPIGVDAVLVEYEVPQ